jgi:uncharacterized protein YxeA
MNFIKKYKILIIIVLIIILIIVGVILFFTYGGHDSGRGNNYIIDDEVIELPGTVTYKSETLSSKHCLNDICISDAIFYYNGEIGRVEYKITNTSNKKKSGYLHMVFKDQTLLVRYKDLEPNKTVESKSQYTGIEITDKSDYKLEELTKEEINKIKK